MDWPGWKLHSLKGKHKGFWPYGCPEITEFGIGLKTAIRLMSITVIITDEK